MASEYADCFQFHYLQAGIFPKATKFDGHTDEYQMHCRNELIQSMPDSLKESVWTLVLDDDELLYCTADDIVDYCVRLEQLKAIVGYLHLINPPSKLPQIVTRKIQGEDMDFQRGIKMRFYSRFIRKIYPVQYMFWHDKVFMFADTSIQQLREDEIEMPLTIMDPDIGAFHLTRSLSRMTLGVDY